MRRHHSSTITWGGERVRPARCLSWVGLIVMASGVAVCPENGWSQQAPADATAVAWKVGDRVVYDVEKVRRRTVDGETTQHTARMAVTIRVIATNRVGYRIAWTSEGVVFEDVESARALADLGIGDVLRSQEIVLACSHEGIPQTVENWRELQERHVASVKLLREHLVATGLNDAEADSMVTQARRLFDSEESIRVFCLGAATLVFLPYSFDFSEGDEIEFPDHLPNPFGDGLLPVTSRMVLTRPADATGPFTLTWTQTLDQEKGSRIVQETLGSADSQAKGIDFSMLDEANFVMPNLRDWIDRLDHARTVESNGAKQVVTTRFVRRQPPALDK